VADRRQRLDAEEEGAPELVAHRRRYRADQRARAASQIGDGERAVRNDVCADDDREEARPGQREEIVIKAERREEGQALATGVEGPVAIEQPLFVDAADDRPEAEVFRLLDAFEPRARHGTIAAPCAPACCAFSCRQYSSILMRGMPFVIQSGAGAPWR